MVNPLILQVPIETGNGDLTLSSYFWIPAAPIDKRVWTRAHFVISGICFVPEGRQKIAPDASPAWTNCRSLTRYSKAGIEKHAARPAACSDAGTPGQRKRTASLDRTG